MVERSLNLGCGNDLECTDRIDMFKTKTTTKIANLNKKFPYPSETFSYIKARSVLEHIKNVGNFVDECHRVLKKGGKIYMRTDHAGFLPSHLLAAYEPNRSLDVQYAGSSFDHKQGEDHHYYLFSESHLKYLFKDFKDVKISYVYGGRNRLFTVLLKLLPKHTGACHIELTARK